MHTIEGTVVRGSRRAAALGFPTINIETDAAPEGIFAADVVIAGEHYRAAAFGDPERGVLEAHLLDASGDFYGQEASITLHVKLRETRHYETDEALHAAIASDVAQVRAYFADV